MIKQNGVATKEDLQKIEKKLGDQLKIVKTEVRDLHDQVSGLRNTVRVEMDELHNKIQDEMTLLRSDVAGMKDEMVTEVKAMREEFAAHQFSHDRQQEELDLLKKNLSSQ